MLNSGIPEDEAFGILSKNSNAELKDYIPINLLKPMRIMFEKWVEQQRAILTCQYMLLDTPFKFSLQGNMDKQRSIIWAWFMKLFL
jgi:hypothetical protein